MVYTAGSKFILLQPITEETNISSGSSSSDNTSTATMVPLEVAFLADTPARPSPGNPFAGGLELRALPAQVIKCVMFYYMPLILRP